MTPTPIPTSSGAARPCAKIDKTGSTIQVTQDGLFKVDQVPVFRLVARPDGVYVQVRDEFRMRCQCRGSAFIEVPVDVFIQQLQVHNP
jgi:hypothetical protein